MNFKKILVAVDASDNAMRAVEYTGEIMCVLSCGNPDSVKEFHITLLSVERLPDRDVFPDDASWQAACVKNKDDVLEFLERARQRLLGKCLPEDILETRYLVSPRSPAAEGQFQRSLGGTATQEILHVLKEEDYGTVVVGRRGVSKDEEFLFGSVSSKIMRKAQGCTIWVVN